MEVEKFGEQRKQVTWRVVCNIIDTVDRVVLRRQVGWGWGVGSMG